MKGNRKKDANNFVAFYTKYAKNQFSFRERLVKIREATTISLGERMRKYV